MLNAVRNNSKILRKEASTIQNSIKDNNIIHKTKINDSVHAKINNDISSAKNIYKQFLYPKFKNNLSNELK